MIYNPVFLPLGLSLWLISNGRGNPRKEVTMT
jgi:hypothetical protein